MKRIYEVPETIEIKPESESLLIVESPVESEPLPNGTDEDAGAKRISQIFDDEE